MYPKPSSLIAAITLTTTGLSAFAQDKKLLTDEALMKAALQQSTYSIDTGARGIVLYNSGEAIVEMAHLTYKVETIIKVIGQEAAGELASINVYTPQGTNIRKIKGETFNLENDVIVKQAIEKSDVLSDATTKSSSIKKFNLPSVKAGSVIHYTYILERPALIAPNWNFQQQNYPTLYSEYTVSQPGSTEYTPIINSAVPFKDVSNEQGLGSGDALRLKKDYGVKRNEVTWVRRNVSAFRPEPFMASEDNYLERLKFNLIFYGSNYFSVKYAADWKSLSKSFYEYKEGFGQPFEPNNFLNDKVAELTGTKTDKLQKAKAVFTYVRDSIALKESSYNDFSALSDIRDVFKRREGSMQGTNLLLIAMLRKAGLESQLVVLSTRDAEHLDPLMPNPNAINYVAARVKIDSSTYFLDAADKYMPFGVLPQKCYNGYCRIIDKTPEAAELHPDDLKDKNTVIVSLQPDAQAADKLLLKVEHKYGDLSGAELRSACKGDTAKLKEKILKDLGLLSMPATLAAYSATNLNNADAPLTLRYEAKVNWDPAAGLVYLDPYFDKLHSTNPFKTTERKRKYPVELDYLSDTRYLFSFQLPAGYVVDDYPKSRVLNFGDQQVIQLKNMLAYDEQNKVFKLECRYTERTTVYPPESYPQLLDFHDNIIAEQQKKIVLKKIN